MRYPSVLILRDDKDDDIDGLVTSDVVRFTPVCSNSQAEIDGLYSLKYHILVTYKSEDKYLSIRLPERIHRRWLHIETSKSVEELNDMVNSLYASLVVMPKDLLRPAFSIFTTCYNSYDKIDRAYLSLLSQTEIDWEWVIMDDSPSDDHFQTLKSKLKDGRVRLYRRNGNSGSIGEVKNEAISLCRGKYIVEFDHDDELTQECLQDAKSAFEGDPEVGFVYMDFINMYEDEKPFFYGNTDDHNVFICKGYGGYVSLRFRGKWQYMYLTPNINNITLSHLVCCPNHPRIWRADVLRERGSYSELLPICDDLEILLSTLNKYKAAKVCKLGYIQYMNPNNNNFSLIRNAEINRLGPKHIAPEFFNRYNVDDVMRDKDAYENPDYRLYHSNIWTREASYFHKYWNSRIGSSKKSILIFNPHQFGDPVVDEYKNKEDRMVYLVSPDKELHFLQLASDTVGIKNIMLWYLPGSNKTSAMRYVTMLLLGDDEELIALDC